MKKIILISLAAFAAFISCQKAISDVQIATTAPQTVTASITQNDTKVAVAIGATKAKINWEADDNITVTDKNGKLGIYMLESGAGTTKATFKLGSEYQEGFGVAPFTAEYGSDFSKMPCEQYYSKTAGATKYLYMKAPESEDADFAFTTQYGLLKLNLKDADHKVTRVIFSSSDGKTVVSISATDPVDIKDGADFYIALPPGKYTKMEVLCGEWSHAVKTIDFEIAANQVRSAKSAALYFEGVGALPGTFKVNAEGKKVSFSPGNLYWDVDRNKWRFEAYQCDYSTWNNGGESPCCKNGKYYAINKDEFNTIGHFFWTTKAADAYIETAPSSSLSSGDNFFANDSSVMGPDWVTLSQSEWNYIFNERDQASLKRGFGTIVLPSDTERILGIILIPDSFSDPGCGSVYKAFGPSRDGKYSWADNVYNFADWNTYMEPAGAVFLPMTFYRAGGTVYTNYKIASRWYGLYWTGSTKTDTDAYAAEFSTDASAGSTNISGVTGENYQYGFSVRLVTEVK